MPLASSRNIVKISAAGSGKTYDVCKEALEVAKNGSRVLITTYTNIGAETVKKEIRKLNEGVLNPLVVIKTWFTFIMSDMIKPYQQFLTNEINYIKYYDFINKNFLVNYKKLGDMDRYITEQKNVRHEQAASLVMLLNKLSKGKIIRRLEEVYQTIFLDEIQDMAGDDIEIIRHLIISSVNVVCCGDNKQATFQTHYTKKIKIRLEIKYGNFLKTWKIKVWLK